MTSVELGDLGNTCCPNREALLFSTIADIEDVDAGPVSDLSPPALFHLGHLSEGFQMLLSR